MIIIEHIRTDERFYVRTGRGHLQERSSFLSVEVFLTFFIQYSTVLYCTVKLGQ
jgi:hypothetical protein